MEIPGLGPVTRDDEFGWYLRRTTPDRRAPRRDL
jgi:hypothetical protein